MENTLVDGLRTRDVPFLWIRGAINGSRETGVNPEILVQSRARFDESLNHFFEWLNASEYSPAHVICSQKKC